MLLGLSTERRVEDLGRAVLGSDSGVHVGGGSAGGLNG